MSLQLDEALARGEITHWLEGLQSRNVAARDHLIERLYPQRRVVVDHERHRFREKRGGGRADGSVEEVLRVAVESPRNPVDVLPLDAALTELRVIGERAAQVVELRYLAGFSHDEVAEVLGIGRATVARSWRFARAWLRRRLQVPTASVIA